MSTDDKCSDKTDDQADSLPPIGRAVFAEINSTSEQPLVRDRNGNIEDMA
jgi:hypothetical protein